MKTNPNLTSNMPDKHPLAVALENLLANRSVNGGCRVAHWKEAKEALKKHYEDTIMSSPVVGYLPPTVPKMREAQVVSRTPRIREAKVVSAAPAPSPAPAPVPRPVRIVDAPEDPGFRPLSFQPDNGK